MSFQEETPLEDVLKHVKQATASPDSLTAFRSTSTRSACRKRRSP